MSKRYCIWDKVSDVYTPSGAVFTAAQWMEKYPIAKVPGVTVLGSAGEITGGYFGTLGQLKTMCERQGATFDAELSGQDLLDAIEAWEDEQAAKAAEEAAELANQPTAEERIAAAMEFQNMLTL